ncbi:phage head-tail connector protein [Paenibacillus sp. 79R4]|uniref:phage head-tail connector protein n=1 Tax=Paenibacillus sp. 79R4 TaxID=2212847 RepID=UPI0015B9AA16
MDQLQKLKIQLGIKQSDDSQDDELKLLLDDVETDLLTWTNRTELPVTLDSTQRQISVIRYNKQGVEGESSHSEGGISRSFDDLPKGLQDSILQKRLAKLVTYQ